MRKTQENRKPYTVLQKINNYINKSTKFTSAVIFLNKLQQKNAMGAKFDDTSYLCHVKLLILIYEDIMIF